MIELVLDPRHASRIARVPLIASRRTGARPRSTAVDLVWYEHADPGLVLLRDGATVRLERPLGRAGWIVGATVVAVSDHHAGLGHDVGAVPVARATFAGRRRRFNLSPPGPGLPPVTLTVLAGIVGAGGEDRPSCRVRLAGGSEEDLAGLAETLMVVLGASPARAPLGAAPADSDPTEAPAPPSPGAEETVDEAIGSIVGSLGLALLFWAPRATASAGDRPVHQMRVAIRRLRSALLVFRDAIAGSLDAEADALRTLASTLGAARDRDVFLSETAPAIEAALPPGESLARLRALAESARAEAYQALRGSLADDLTRHLLARLALAPFRHPWAAANHADAADPDRAPVNHLALSRIAPALVERRFRRLVRKRRSLDGLSSETLHDVRKDAKKLRYTLEFLGEALPHRATRKLVKRLASLQEALGAINDSATGTTLLGRLAPDAATGDGGVHEREAGIVVGWLAAEAARRRDTVDALWSAVRRTDRFWRG